MASQSPVEVLYRPDEFLAGDDQKIVGAERRNLSHPPRQRFFQRTPSVDLPLRGHVGAAPVGEGDTDVVGRVAGLEVQPDGPHPCGNDQPRHRAATEPVYGQVRGQLASEDTADLPSLPRPAHPDRTPSDRPTLLAPNLRRSTASW